MTGVGGGVAAAFGFRYQYLVTVELLLDLYESFSRPDWRVDVDRVDQDSADILVSTRSDQGPVRALQVKASMPASSTTMNLRMAVTCLDAMEAEHPEARELTLVTNRTLTSDAAEYATRLNARSTTTANERRRIIDTRTETLLALTSKLVERVARIRVRGRGGIGQRLHHILVAQLVDLVHDRGSQTSCQGIDRDQIAGILDESAAVLADACGGRTWGRTFGVPDDRYLPRQEIAAFLSFRLPDDDLLSGTPSVAVLSGMSGSGKSAAAAAWAASRREHYAFTLWMDASSDEVLMEQQPAILSRLVGEGYIGDAPAQTFCDLLSDVPVPWLLVLDGAADWATTHNWVPSSGYGHVIVTTNRGDWPFDPAPLLRVEAMTPAEATGLIRHRLSTPGQAGPADAVDPVAVEFAAQLGSWPLAIDLACTWVRSLGGNFSRLREFLERLSRFDPMEQGTPLGSYPKGVGGIVRELLNGLSEQGLVVLGVVAMSGGSHVPAALIEEWASTLPDNGPRSINTRAAIDELVKVSLIKKQLRYDVKSIRGLDEAIYVHEGILVIFHRLAIGIEYAYVHNWVRTCTEVLTRMFNQALFSDATALMPAADATLTSLLSAEPSDDDLNRQAVESIQLSATFLMHNLGTLATLTGLFDLASKWLTAAFDLREHLGSDADRHEPALAATQIQTLAALAQAVARQKRPDKIRPILAAAAHYGQAHPFTDLDTPSTPISAALHTLRDAAKYAQEDNSGLDDWIVKALEQSDGVVPESFPAQLRVQSFAGAVERARRYAETEQWSKATDTVLVVANEAVAAEVLVHDGIEAVLDIGLSLIGSLLSRPHRQAPAPLTNAMWRIVQWCREFSDLLNDDQRARFSILAPIADLDVPGLCLALEKVEAAVENSNQLRGWAKLGDIAKKTIEASNRVHQLWGEGSLPGGFTVMRSIDGGTNALWWSVKAGGNPVLVFVTASATMYVGDVVMDPLLETIIRAGFPDRLDADGQPRAVPGWTVRVDGLNLVLRDGSGQAWLELDVDPDEQMQVAWIDAIQHADRIRVIYADLADLPLDELFAVPNQGLVNVTGRPRSRFANPLRRFMSRSRNR
ncbi:hypothetical protein SAMN04489729_2624 [Amycolatopsis lurida]|uniref:NB-ARC domain-containing protein n=1 Tax=Amycolatopsis lurida NRRL 2430 TaxID=1460371 RepID=A0A2P2FFD6_AMYLU|nr:hypothetical protein [Amycolatopsis lurida]KFU75438.1 hypothetical protein BB31_41505 [Amycolatopsis lurida NRRL 2430]SEC84980.1 hypothetical protein SAMN04489729_2624 [Amycolatopsis lurida]